MYPPKTPGTYGTSFGQSPISQPRNQQILEEVPLDVGVDVEVVGGTYDGMRGGVVKIGSGKTSVQLVVNDDQKIVDILASQLKPTIPKKGDTVRVVRGKDKGKTGTLSSVLLEDGDVVFKNSENSKDILYLKLVDLVKLVKQ
jgi:ribosomal protein S4E